MYKYVIKDLMAAGRYLPHTLVFAVVLLVVIVGINHKRREKGKVPVRVLPTTFFVAYGFLVLLMTFLSRSEVGYTGIDLRLFSSFGINRRNNAYIIENILLFVPFGFGGAWVGAARNVFLSLLLGAGISFFIESMQYATGRGVFQLDDIMTNTVGMVIGCVIFGVCNLLFRRRR